MRASTRPSPQSRLTGWRARAWAWVLFVALFKGLVPHAAIASAVMQSAPGVVWCAPGSSSMAAAADAQPTTEHGCLCANAGDGAMPLLAQVAAGSLTLGVQMPSALAARPDASQMWLPPARGPPVWVPMG